MAGNDKISNEDLYILLKEIAAQNTEISVDVKQIKKEISEEKEKINELYNKVKVLEEKNNVLENKLKATQRKIKRNSLIIFGIPEEEKQDLEITIVTLIKEKLKISIEETEIDNIYRVGVKRKDNSRPIVLELVRNIIKQQILKNTFKLKGTNITITNDLIEEDAEEKKVLYKHLKLAKEKQYNARIHKNKLIINGESYTSDQLEKIFEEVCNIQPRKPHSTPATPTNFDSTYINSVTGSALDLKTTANITENEKRNTQERQREENINKGEKKEIQKSLNSTPDYKEPNSTHSAGPSISTRSGKKLQNEKVTTPTIKKAIRNQ